MRRHECRRGARRGSLWRLLEVSPVSTTPPCGEGPRCIQLAARERECAWSRHWHIDRILYSQIELENLVCLRARRSGEGTIASELNRGIITSRDFADCFKRHFVGGPGWTELDNRLDDLRIGTVDH